MSVPDDQPFEMTRQRFLKLLETLAERGHTQRAIAGRAGMTEQHLTDLKMGRREVSELTARRLAAAWNINYEWLTGSSDSLYPAVVNSPWEGRNLADRIWLPVFQTPILGEPHLASEWDGTLMDVSIVARPLLERADMPYVLVFGHNDQGGRLKKNDRVLISQSLRTRAELSVVQWGRKLFLARPSDDGLAWERAANGERLPKSCPAVGHCLAVVWSPLRIE